MQKQVAKKAFGGAANKLKASVGLGDSGNFDYESAPLEWRNYNYPPLLRLTHYSTDKLTPEFKSQVRRMHIAALLILA